MIREFMDMLKYKRPTSSAFEEMFMNNEIGWRSDSFNVHHHVHKRGELIRRAFVKIFGKDDLMTRWITLWAEAPYLIDWPDGNKLPAWAGGTFSEGGLKKMVEEGERPEERERVRSLVYKYYTVGLHEHHISWWEVGGINEEEAIAAARKGDGNHEGNMKFIGSLDIDPVVEEG